jgi:hypothetical protein
VKGRSELPPQLLTAASRGSARRQALAELRTAESPVVYRAATVGQRPERRSEANAEDMPPPKKAGKKDSKRRRQNAVVTENFRATKRKAGVPRSPLRAVRVLCHGCVLDRGSVRCVKARVLGCCAFSVLCQGKSAWLLCVQARAQPLLSAWLACLECAVPCAWIGAVGVKARLLGCYSFTVLCQGKSVCVMRVGCALSRQECLCYACRQCAVGVLEYCCERALVVLVPWAE